MKKIILALFIVSMFFATASVAQVKTSGLPLPRFASIKTKQANMRSGPGLRYPIEWVYLKKGLPVEIIADFENWRLVRDWEGTEGWIHVQMLYGKRMARVMGVERILRKRPNENARPIAKIESGVIGLIEKCPRASKYCKLDVKGYKGWLKRDEFWGIYPKESIE